MNMIEELTFYKTRVNQALSVHLPPPSTRLHEAMRYAVLNGGKRIRPIFVYAVGTAFGASLEQLDKAACAVECIHAYSLIHDDLPAMDNDDFRRGLPTCHKAFDEATAILAGDALQTLAFQILAEDETLSPEQRLNMINILTKAIGSLGMAGGQAADLEAFGQKLDSDALENIHRHKTGALMKASVCLGAWAANLTDPHSFSCLERYIECIGLAFQIQDDIVDGVQQDNADSPSYFHTAGIPAARARVDNLYQEALGYLDYFSEKGRFLRSLSEYLLNLGG